MSYTGTTGGGEVSQTEARRNTETQMRNAKMDSIQKRQQYRSDLKRKEDKDINRKKMEQRRRTEANKSQEKDRQERLENDHRRTNEAFLKRLEAENRAKRVAKLTGGQSSEADASGGDPEVDHRVAGAVSCTTYYIIILWLRLALSVFVVAIIEPVLRKISMLSLQINSFHY